MKEKVLILVLILGAQFGAKAEMQLGVPVEEALEYSHGFGNELEIDLSFHTQLRWSKDYRWGVGKPHHWMELEDLYSNLHHQDYFEIVRADVDLIFEELISPWYVRNRERSSRYLDDKAGFEDPQTLPYEQGPFDQIEASYMGGEEEEPYQTGFATDHGDTEPSYQNIDFYGALEDLGKGSYDINVPFEAPGS